MRRKENFHEKGKTATFTSGTVESLDALPQCVPGKHGGTFSRQRRELPQPSARCCQGGTLLARDQRHGLGRREDCSRWVVGYGQGPDKRTGCGDFSAGEPAMGKLAAPWQSGVAAPRRRLVGPAVFAHCRHLPERRDTCRSRALAGSLRRLPASGGSQRLAENQGRRRIRRQTKRRTAAALARLQGML